MEFNARHYQTGSWVRITIQGQTIAAVSPADGPGAVGEEDDWIAPAFWDIQLNGRWGVSFSDPGLSVDQVEAIVRAQGELGTARLCPTLITAPIGHLRHGLATVAEACHTFPEVSSRVIGIHLE